MWLFAVLNLSLYLHKCWESKGSADIPDNLHHFIRSTHSELSENIHIWFKFSMIKDSRDSGNKMGTGHSDRLKSWPKSCWLPIRNLMQVMQSFLGSYNLACIEDKCVTWTIAFLWRLSQLMSIKPLLCCRQDNMQ